MSDIAIKVEGLGKKYKIGTRKSGNFRESFGLFWNKLKGKPEPLIDGQINRSTDQQTNSEFWALKDINFEIKRGEAVGIIGRNGAGKSTLLKILSRITKPTTGRFEINGRVSSLLEVGTGFHKELTGRENIFLNGAILGMTRREIKQKFDEIVDFSGVEQFIDTPVKHYSSGMLVRLAFSVAAHLEPEILIIDEVLAVGDAEFQKKCLGKMEDVTGQGRTVLFVSHNMGAVRNLCGRGILIREGLITKIGEINDVVREYELQNRSSNSSKILFEELDLKLQFPSIIKSLDSIEFTLLIKKPAKMLISEAAILFYNLVGERITIIDLREASPHIGEEILEYQCLLNKVPLIEGFYKIGLYLNTNMFRKDFLDLTEISIIPADRPVKPFSKNNRGLVELDYSVKLKSK